jgi:endogenous inhibitor of DNA gyrase (YacG/DUF329 family)
MAIAVPCPTCGSLYVEWTNYEKIRGAYGKKSQAYGNDT